MSNLRRFLLLQLISAVFLLAGCSSDVKVGVVLSQSGSLAPIGDKMKKAIDLAADEINAAGGASGGKIVLVYKDDATIADAGKRAVLELIEEDGVPVIVGAISSTVALAVAPICEEKGVVLLSPAASNSKLTAMGMHIFRNCPSDIFEGTSMAKFAQEVPVERVVVFAVNNDFASGLTEVFTQQFESRFRKVVATYRFDDRETSVFADLVQQAKQLNPDGVFIVAYQNDQVDLVKELQSAGVKAVVMASSAITGEVIKAMGDAGEGVVYPQAVFDVKSDDPAVSSFVNAYRARYSEDPDIYAAHGYDALKLVARAIELNKSTHPDNIMTGLAQIKDYQGAAGRTEFDANGDVVRYPRIFIIRDGVAISYDEFKSQGGSLLPTG